MKVQGKTKASGRAKLTPQGSPASRHTGEASTSGPGDSPPRTQTGSPPLAAPQSRGAPPSPSEHARPALNLNALAGLRRRGNNPVDRRTQEAVARIHAARVEGRDFLDIASAEISAGRVGPMIKAFEFILSLQPENLNSLEELHHIYVVARRPEEAAGIASTLQRLKVPPHRLSFGAALLAEASQKPDLALELGQKALDSLSGPRALAEAVATAAEKAAAQDPTRAGQAEERRSYATNLAQLERDVRLFLAQTLGNTGRSEESYRAYLELDPSAPLRIDHAILFARAALLAGDFDRAAATAERPREDAQEPPNLRAYLKSLGFAAHASAKRHEHARALWPEASALWNVAFGSSTGADLGTGLAVAGHLVAGVVALGDRAMLLEVAKGPLPRGAQVAHAPSLAVALTEVGEIDAAFALLEAAAATRPEAIIPQGAHDGHAAAVLALARFQNHFGRREDALATLRRGLDEVRPGAPEEQELGVALLHTTLDGAKEHGIESIDRKKFEATLDRLSKAGPSPELLELRARFSFAQGLYGEAVVAARRAAELKPEDPNLAMLHGVCLSQGRRTEQKERAIVVLQRALALAPDRSVVQETLSRTFLALGRHAEARAANRAALASEPTSLMSQATRLEIELDALRQGLAAHPDLEPTAELAQAHAQALAVLTGAQAEILRAGILMKTPERGGVPVKGRTHTTPRIAEAHVREAIQGQVDWLEATIRRLPMGLQKATPETRIDPLVAREDQTEADRERAPPQASLVKFRPTPGAEETTGRLLGWTSRGKFVVKAEDKYFSVSQVEHCEPVRWPSAVESVPRAFRSRPHGAFRELLEYALDRPVCGPHTAREFARELGETLLVGGAVRDAIHHAASPERIERFKAKRADVDLVTSATPVSAMYAGRRVASDVMGRGGELGGLISDHRALSQGGIRLANAEDPESPGIDISAIRVHEHAVPFLAGRDLCEDAFGRDFACNSVYYDPTSGLLLDPTGHGLEDAKNRHLRITSDRYLESNQSHALRFARFRLDGFTADRETIEAMKKNARRFFGQRDVMVRKLARLVPSSHRRPAAIEHWLSRLVGKLEEDGFVHDRMDAARLLRPLFKEVIQTCLDERNSSQPPRNHPPAAR